MYITRLQRYLVGYQWFGVYFMLQQLHGLIGGVFLSNLTGFGKTTETIVLLATEVSLNNAFKEVRDAQDKEEEGHLPADSEDDYGACPSMESGVWRYKFPCPCAPSNVTAEFKPREGPMLIVVPASLMFNWAKEIQATLNGELGIEVFLAFRLTRAQKGQFGQLSEANRERFRGEVDGSGVLRAKKGQSKLWIITTPESYRT